MYASLQEKLSSLESNFQTLAKTSLIPEAQLPIAYLKKNHLNQYLLSLKLPSSFFAILRDQELSVSFLLQVGAIPDKRICDNCGRSMSLVFKARDERYQFECECGIAQSLIEKTIWGPSKLHQDKILLYVFFWVMNLRDKEIQHLLGINYKEAKFCDTVLRSLISGHYMKNLPKFKGIVEIDESCFRSSKSRFKFGQNSAEK